MQQVIEAKNSLSAVSPRLRRIQTDQPHIGLLILFGPEVRALLYSGLADSLGELGPVSILTTQPGSAAFTSLGEVPVHYVPACGEPRLSRKIRTLNRRAHENWIDERGHPRWSQQRRLPRESASGHNSISRRTSGSRPRWLRTLSALENALSRASQAVKSWQQLYEQLGLDCVIAMDYASPRAVTALQAAQLSGVTTIVLTNSWKDVYAHPYLPVAPTCIGVSAEPEAVHLRRANPQFEPKRVAAVGSLHLAPFQNPAEMISRSQFCESRGLDPRRPIVCYTAASPSAVSGEESIVETLLGEVASHPARPQVLLRANPREDSRRFQALAARYPHLRIEEPRWEWNPQADWNAPLREDVDEWVATVFHSAFNVSIPSTVTLEFTAFGRLTLNVCYDVDPGTASQNSNRRFWDAPFYRQVRDSPLVAAAFSESDFREMVSYRLAEPGAWTLQPRRTTASPVELAARLVATALAEKLTKIPPSSERRAAQVEMNRRGA